jgi:effector-binding domain-containing protein
MIDTPTIHQVAAQRTATIHLTISGTDMPSHMDPAIKEVLKVLSDQGITPTGPMFCYHHRMPTDTFDFEVGFPVDREVAEHGRVKPSSIPAAKVARTIHHGPYEELHSAWQAFNKWVKENNVQVEDRFFERYLDDPTKQDPSEYRTEINRCLKS